MISVNHLYKDFGSLKVLKDVTFSVAEKEVVVIIGPSGSGKSTVLRCINYLETPTSGSIVVDGLDLSNKANLNDVRKEVGMVFQRFNLFPHKTVLENIILAPMQVRKVSRDEAVENARKLLQKVGLADKEGAYPEQLSGGQQQRV
ncbi:MAG: ATP-binding cassette domain-containing protein, partial [Negativicoccus succinicivorans]|nr:ATP-binding cassette domain-containing protein [Negativicoccus succinicivorans]